MQLIKEIKTIPDGYEITYVTDESTTETVKYTKDEFTKMKALMTKAEIEEMQKASSINLLKKVDQKTQVLMIYYSLRRVHEDVDPETVDYIITYGMDQSEYIQVVNFLLYGVTAEQVSKMQKESELKNVPKAKKTKAKPIATEAEE